MKTHASIRNRPISERNIVNRAFSRKFFFKLVLITEEALETPKKVIESDCSFICSAFIQKKEKIHIFAKISWDFQAIISSCLDVNVGTFTATEELSICKNQCYKRLIKVKKAFDHLNELKQELQATFGDNQFPRTKRLFSKDIVGENSSLPIPARKPSKWLKNPTTCTSSGSNQQEPLLVSSRVPFGISPISYPNEPVRCAFPPREKKSPTCITPLSNPILTSTPVSSCSNVKTSTTSKTVLTVEYPSKTINKTLCGSYQAIGKALAHGVPSQIAYAVMKNPTLRNHVMEKTLKILSKEVAALCSTKNPSLLRKSGKEDLAKFDMYSICNEWKERSPLFYSFLMTTAVNKRTKESTWFPNVVIARSVLLKQRGEKMDATVSVLGILLKSKSIEVRLELCPK